MGITACWERADNLGTRTGLVDYSVGPGKWWNERKQKTERLLHHSHANHQMLTTQSWISSAFRAKVSTTSAVSQRENEGRVLVGFWWFCGRSRQGLARICKSGELLAQFCFWNPQVYVESWYQRFILEHTGLNELVLSQFELSLSSMSWFGTVC